MKIRRVLLLWGLVFNICLFAQEKRGYDYLQLASSPFRVEEGYLSKHDIVYFSPTELEAEGFPMGNGDMGGMIWNNDNGIELQVNKNDLWSDEDAAESNLSVLKHAARLKIDFGSPVFSWIHMNDFKGRLSLEKGEVDFSSTTPYSKVSINTWLAHKKNVWVLECENMPGKDNGCRHNSSSTVSIERIGSRSFSGWYGGWFPKDPSVGLGKTQSDIYGNDIILKETGNGLNFAVACRILDETASPNIVSCHRVEQKTQKQKFTILLSVVTSRESENPVADACKLLDEVQVMGIARLKVDKDTAYHNFWSNSFMKLGNDYLENIYYLRRYLMFAGSQGEFPVAFNGGLWRWNRDVMNWVTPHHWNTQQQYWGLCAQNDCQLMLPYLDTYFKMIPQGMALAKENNAINDALQITEAHCFTGSQTSKNRWDMKNNFTPASQIASLFWDYYAFTGDIDFLRNKAYVFMKKAANFYLDKLQWDETKKEFFLYSSLYESASIAYVKNAESDRDCIERLFKNCIQAASVLKVDKTMVSKWNYVLKHLWKRSFQSFETAQEVIAPAAEYFTEERYTPWIWANGGAIAFPAGLIGIDDKDTRLGKAVTELVKCRQDANAHYPFPEVAARMGMGDEALQYIINGINIHQMYPQGLMHNVTGYPDNIYNLKSVHDLLGNGFSIRSHAFFQCGMEPISNYATAMNEMMLQSNEDKIRVFPAIPTAWDSVRIAFTLLARDGFIVSAERNEQACVTQVGIKSLQGKVCRIQNPWPGKEVTVTCIGKGNVNVKTDSKDVVIFKTHPNTEYSINIINTLPVEQTIYEGTPNTKVKRLGRQCLGRASGWNGL